MRTPEQVSLGARLRLNRRRISVDFRNSGGGGPTRLDTAADRRTAVTLTARVLGRLVAAIHGIDYRGPHMDCLPPREVFANQVSPTRSRAWGVNVTCRETRSDGFEGREEGTNDARAAARRIAAARLISLTGSEAARIALVVALYQRTESARWIGVGLLTQYLTRGLLTPAAGALGDRFDRRRVMVASDLAGAACFCSLALVRAPWLLILLAFLASAAETPFFPAASAAIPNLAPGNLAWANATVVFRANVGFLLGPAIGGMLSSAIGPSGVFLVNAASFAVSAAIVAAVRGSFSQAPESTGTIPRPPSWNNIHDS
jgi:hypothetical protein